MDLLIQILQAEILSKGEVINKAKELKYDTSKLVKSLKILFRKGCDLATIVDSLRHIKFTKNINNLLIQLEILTSKSADLYFIIGLNTVFFKEIIYVYTPPTHSQTM